MNFSEHWWGGEPKERAICSIDGRASISASDNECVKQYKPLEVASSLFFFSQVVELESRPPCTLWKHSTVELAP